MKGAGVELDINTLARSVNKVAGDFDGSIIVHSLYEPGMGRNGISESPPSWSDLITRLTVSERNFVNRCVGKVVRGTPEGFNLDMLRAMSPRQLATIRDVRDRTAQFLHPAFKAKPRSEEELYSRGMTLNIPSNPDGWDPYTVEDLGTSWDLMRLRQD